MKFESFGQISKNIHISNLMKIRLMGAELFHADGQTDGHDEAKSSLSQIL